MNKIGRGLHSNSVMCQQKFLNCIVIRTILPNKSEVVAYLIVIIFLLKEYFGGGNIPTVWF